MNADPKIVGDMLIVDDNPGDVRLLQETLKETDLDPTVHTVSDGSDAVAFLQQRGEFGDAPVPDAILLDLHLAKMDGDEVLEKMGDELKDIPVIAVSGSEEGASLKLDDIEDKVDTCLVKPVDSEDLTEVLRSQ